MAVFRRRIDARRVRIDRAYLFPASVLCLCDSSDYLRVGLRKDGTFEALPLPIRQHSISYVFKLFLRVDLVPPGTHSGTREGRSSRCILGCFRGRPQAKVMIYKAEASADESMMRSNYSVEAL